MAQAMLAAKLQNKSAANDMGQYERMKKIGLPLASILSKMRLNGVSDDIIAQWGGGGASQAKDDKQQERMIMEVSPTKRMKPFHWAKFNQFQTDKTVWEGVDKAIGQYKINYENLEELFQQFSAQPKADTKKDKKKEEKKDDSEETAFQLIDPHRQQNVMIGLSRIDLKEDEILEAILRMDDNKLPPEKVRKLLPYVPTDGELQMVREYVKNGGDISKLSPAGRFFCKMMDLVDIRSRLNLWLFKSDFPTVIGNIRRRLELVKSTMEQLRTNDNLKHVFTIILAIGNYMNTGSSRGNAFGFHLEPTLNMLEGMKALDMKTSLMMYIVQTCRDCSPQALAWAEELSILPQASKVQTNSVQQDVDVVRRDMNEIEKQNKAAKRTLTKTHIDWARDGAAVPLNQIASHFRVVSRTMDSNLAMKEFATYNALRAPVRPGMGVPGKIGGVGGVNISGGMPHHGPSDSISSEADLGTEDVENMHGKLMLQFYKRANATLREIETLLKQVFQETKKFCQYFGYDETSKWEDILQIFTDFRDRFMKAVRELDVLEQKQKRKDAQQATKNILSQKFKHKPTKDEVEQKTKTTVDLDDETSTKDAKSNVKSSKGGRTAAEVYKEKFKKKNAKH